MVTFPLLSSGAVAQYPAPMVSGQSANVIRFVDGSDQRYLTRGRAFRQWQIRLDLLNETEIAQLEIFFMEQRGALFIFPDPFSGVQVPNCLFGTEALQTSYVGADIGAASLWVSETNG